MKKVILSVVLFASVIAVSAQPRAIGGRFTWGVEASYQHELGSNMIQLDVGVPYFSSIQAVGTYNWIFPISSWQHAGSWNWYAGVGAGAGLGWWWYKNVVWDNSRHNNTKMYGIVGGVGMVGVEYNFKFPLQLSLDYRPLIGVEVSGGDIWFHDRGLFSVAAGVRYKF